MRGAGFLLGSVGVAVGISGCSLPVVEQDLSSGGSASGPPAILEYKETATALARVRLAEVDGRPVALGQGERRNNLFKLSPGKHTVRFRGDEGFAVHPELVEFEARAGERYEPGFERVNFRETEGQATTLYFNLVCPVIFEARDGKPVKVAAGATAPFKTGIDARKYPLLYDDATLRLERTALVYCRREGLLKVPNFSFARIAGRTPEARVVYERSWFDLSQYYHYLPGSWTDPWGVRLLPGEYRFEVTMTSLMEEARSGIPVRGPVKVLSLKAEAGHTYRINPNIEAVSTKFEGVGPWDTRTTMTQVLKWNPVIEDVTGKVPADE